MRHCIIAATLMLTAAAPALAQNPDCTIAQEAADAIAARWSDMAGEAAQGEVTAHTAEGEGGFCAATVSVFVDADSPSRARPIAP